MFGSREGFRNVPANADPLSIGSLFRGTRVVKKLKQRQMAWIRILPQTPFSNGLLRARNSAYNLAFTKVIDYRGIQDALGAPARLFHWNVNQELLLRNEY